MWQLVARNIPTMNMKNLLGHLQQLSLTALFLTDVIDANKNRAMSTTEVGNAFVRAKNDTLIIVLLCGKVS